VVSAFDGWNAIYIGRNTPTEDIVSAANQNDVRALALSIVYPADDPVLARELIRLKDLLNDNVALLVGGRAASGYAKTLRQIGAIMPRSLTELRTILGKIRAQKHSGVN
jgi:methylmalonyl-CoA mutase cobalamin-binding subunit